MSSADDRWLRLPCPNPSCKRQLRVPASFAGQEVKCRHCGSAIRVPSMKRESRIMMVRAICNVNGMPFSILFRSLGSTEAEGWIAEKAFKRTEQTAEARYQEQTLRGICIDANTYSCPYCGDNGLFRCSCGLLNCLGAVIETTDNQTVACCAKCGSSGVVGGRGNELKGRCEQ